MKFERYFVFIKIIKKLINLPISPLEANPLPTARLAISEFSNLDIVKPHYIRSSLKLIIEKPAYLQLITSARC